MKLRGFTLMELLVVFGVIVVILGFSVPFDFNTYRADAFRAERDMLVTLLQTARGNALHNIDEKPHGVAVVSDKYVLFRGTDAREDVNAERIDVSYPGLSASPVQIIFCQLSGTAVTHISEGMVCDDATNRTEEQNIVLTDSVRGLSYRISINHEGAISW